MELISKEELTQGKKGFLPNLIASAAMAVFGINNINRLYAGTYGSGDQCAAKLLSILDTTYVVDEKELENIPREGGVVIICNHPTGGLDGVLLIDLLSKIRPDVKFMGNFILQKIQSLNNYFIPVDPFRSHDPRHNIKGIKTAYAHVEGGGALMIFPAGEVSSWQKNSRRIEDRPWNRSIMRFIRECGVPVVPMFIEARNSRKFYIMGSLHPLVRMALQPREFTNKRHMRIPVHIGAPIYPADTQQCPEQADYSESLREAVDRLRFRRERTKR